MKRIRIDRNHPIARRAALVGATCIAGAWLAGCGGGSDSSSGDVTLRLANATITHPSLSLLVNSNTAVSATATDTVSATTSASSGTVALQVNDAGGGTSLVTTQPTLTGGLHYVLVAYESGGAVRAALVNEDYTIGATGATNLRIVDVAPEAGRLDLYITTSACSTANLTALSPTGSFTTLPLLPLAQSQGAGTYNVCVTAQGSKTDIRLAMPITLAGANAATLVLTPASGGALLNGSLILQQSTYTATRNTNARVRLAAAVSPGATVAATVSGGAVIDAGSAAPNYGFYTLVPAAGSVNVTVNGASVGLSSGALRAGSDSTLLVTGTAAAPVATLLGDDNRPPTDPTTAKIRLVNGLTGNTGSLTLIAGSSPIGINVTPGTASGYATITPAASTTTALQLTSSSNGLIKTDTANTLIANTVYSVLAVGDGTAAGTQLLVR